MEAKSKLRAKVGDERVARMRNAIAKLASDYKPKPPVEGDIAPDFTLNDALGTPVNLASLLQSHTAVVLTWYRGGWCPFCNATLDSLIIANEYFEEVGAKLVTVTPETPDESVSTIEEMGIPFHVLSDDGLKVAESYGIAYVVPEEMKGIYHENSGLDLDRINGNEGKREAKLPVPATFVLDKEGKVVFLHADLNHTTRAEPADIIKAIQSIIE
ncbi:Thioredoxin [Gracilaria domingensis]|nr:Thioredoxin [Gracilaria domingensis]